MPIVLGLFALGALFYFATQANKHALGLPPGLPPGYPNGPPGEPGQPPQPGQPAQPGQPQAPAMCSATYDPGRPINCDLNIAIQQELLNDNDPAALAQFAGSLLPDYPGSASLLQQKADKINALPVQPPQPPQPQPSPVVPVPNPPTPAQPDPTPPTDTQPTWAAAPTGAPDGMETFDTAPPWSTNVPSVATMEQVQHALNAWARAVDYPDPYGIFPLNTDGNYGKMTADAALPFQRYANVVYFADIDEDGRPGGLTQAWLVNFGPIG